jgi:very-short-patch-repair endonuclease
MDGSKLKTPLESNALQEWDCHYCGKKFLKKHYRAKAIPKYCNMQCMKAAWEKTHVTKECPHCGEEFTTGSAKNAARFCSNICGIQFRATGETGVYKSCEICGEEFFASLRMAKFRPQATCSLSCSRKRTWKVSRENMEAGVKRAGIKKRGRTPWNKGIPTPPEVIARRKPNTPEQIKAFKAVRGGNGTGMTKCEKLLRPHLPERYSHNVVIKTEMPRNSGYPTCYKVDFGSAAEKIAVEVDGSSHNSLKRQAQDRKKEEFLSRLGWYVYRISNQQVLSMCGTSKLQDLKTILPMVK